MATKTIGYIRVSTEKQVDHGVSLEAQRAKIESYAFLYELELVEIIVDAGESASTLNRPGLQKALGMLKAGKAEALLCLKLDRLTRSVRDLSDLISGPFAPGRAGLLSVSEQFDTRSAAGRMVLNIMAVVSQWEREAIGERTKTAMQHLASQGRYVGGRTPYGFRIAPDGLHLEEVAEEQAILSEVKELRGSGLSFQKMAVELAQRGRRNRHGGTFAPAGLHRLLAA